MLNVLNDRVIIDSHEPTREQCETMTLLANVLDKSVDFKTVSYVNGYAEFERVGRSGELRFLPARGFAIYSKDGITILAVWDGDTVDGDEEKFIVTATGLSQILSTGNEVKYTYSGSETFKGFAKTINSQVPDYAVGSTISTNDSNFSKGFQLCIVEGGGYKYE